jgi:predicted nuclease of predicted toxin-antitoxin system
VRFLADVGVSPLTIKALRNAEHDAVHLVEQRLERLTDSAILEKALQERRIVLTFDLDFGDLLAASPNTLPSVIIFRLKTTLPDFVTSRLFAVIEDCAADLETGALITVEDGRYRLRRLPIQPFTDLQE